MLWQHLGLERARGSVGQTGEVLIKPVSGFSRRQC